MDYNKSPVSMREGKATLDGVVVMDCIKLEIKFTPDVWSGKQLGERTDSSRWLGGKITANMTRRRTTPFYREKVMEYIKTGRTPELTIQGIQNDENSDFYATYGSEVVTAVGCVPTGDINLINLDSAGQVVEDAVAFNVKDVV